MATFGEKLSKVMEIKRYTRKDIAQIFGVTSDTIGDYLRDKSTPNSKSLERAIEFLGFDINKFTDENYPPTEEAIEIKYIDNTADLSDIINEVKDLIQNNFDMRLEGNLIDKTTRKILTDSIDIGYRLAKEYVRNK